MKVKMLVDLDISYQGESYQCKKGKTINVPDAKAEELIATGMAQQAARAKVVNPPARQHKGVKSK